MKRKSLIFVVALVASAAMVFANGQSEKSSAGSAGSNTAMKAQTKSITVGAKNFTEQYNMGQIIAQMLAANGFKVKEDSGMSSTVVRKGIETGQIDIYADYTGTAWVTYLKNKTVIHDPQKLYEAVKAEDLKKNNIVWLNMLPVNDTYALAVKKDFAEKNNLKTLSDLAALVNKDPKKFSFAIDYEFFQRPDGFVAMAKDYGMNIPKSQIKTMQIGLTYNAIEKNDVNVAMVFSTDGNLKKYNMTVLKDDKQFFPAYNIAICVRKDVLDKYPQIRTIFAPLDKALTQKAMIDMNYQVDAKKQEPANVVKKFLTENNLIK